MKFPKSARVRKRKEYLDFFQNSEVKKTGDCIVFRIKGKLKPRLGITLKSKSTSIIRNQIKRQIREVFRLNQERLGVYDYNVVVPTHAKVDYRTPKRIRESLEKIWTHEVVF